MLKRLFASNKNPCFKESEWDTLDFDLSGTQLQISLPPQDYEFPEKRMNSRINIYAKDLFTIDSEKDENGYTPIGLGYMRQPVLSRKWHTYGTVYKNYIGTLSCNIGIVDTSSSHHPINCFNKAQFESVVDYLAYYRFGPGSRENEYRCPVNWRIGRFADCDYIYFESYSKKAEWEGEVSEPYDAQFDIKVYVPLADDKVLSVGFRALGSLPADASNALMQSRINKIISSLTLNLSPESNKQKTEVDCIFPENHYSSSRDLYRWKYYGSYRRGDFIEGEPPIVFEGKPTPPPQIIQPCTRNNQP